MSDDQYLILFLFIVIIFSSIFYKIIKESGCFFVLIGLIIAILYKRNNCACNCSKKNNCGCNYSENKEIEKFKNISDNNEMIYKSKSLNEEEKSLNEEEKSLNEEENKLKFVESLDRNLEKVKYNYYDIACPGDNRLTSRMLEQGKRAKQSIDNRARFDKYSLLHYFDEELNSSSNSRWWDDDSLEHLF